MANRYLFGKALTFTYYPIESDGTAIVPNALSSAYVFEDKPDRTDALAGTGALQTLGSWSDIGDGGYSIAVTGIDDPDPDGDNYERSYWIVFNYTLTAAEQVQTDIVEMVLARPVGYGAELSIDTTDLESFFPKIDGFLSGDEQLNLIDEAIAHVKAVLRSKRWEYWMITEPEELRQAAIWRALYMSALSLIATGDEGLDVLLENARAEYQTAIARIDIELDTDLDGEPDEKSSIGGYMRILT